MAGSGPSKINESDKIVSGSPQPTDLMVAGNPSTGNLFSFQAGALIALIASSANSPIKIYTTRAAMLANVDIPIGYFAFVQNNGGGWALYFYIGGNRDSLSSYQFLIGENKDTDNHWVDCGTWDTDTLPSVPGSGYGGEILRGNTFDVGDSGTGPGDGIMIGSDYYPKGTTFRALIDNPTTIDHWRIHA